MIKTLDEFTKFLKICRKQGVTDVKFEGISVVFGELSRKGREEADDVEIPTDEMTLEQQMFYSAGAGHENHQG